MRGANFDLDVEKVKEFLLSPMCGANEITPRISLTLMTFKPHAWGKHSNHKPNEKPYSFKPHAWGKLDEAYSTVVFLCF